MLLSPIIRFSTMSNVNRGPAAAAETEIGPVEETTAITKNVPNTPVLSKSSAKSNKKRSRGAHLYDEVGSQNILPGKRTRKTAKEAKERIQIVKEVENEVEEKQQYTEKASEVFDDDLVVESTATFQRYDDEKSWGEISLEEDVLPMFLPDSCCDLAMEYQRRFLLRALEVKRLRKPELFIRNFRKMSKSEAKAALERQVLIAQQHLQLYSTEWVREVLSSEDDRMSLDLLPSSNPEHKAARVRLEAIRDLMSSERKYGDIAANVDVSGLEAPQIVLKPKAKASGNIVVDLEATMKTATMSPKAVDISSKTVDRTKQRPEAKMEERSDLDLDSRCDFDEELLAESKKEFSFVYKIDWRRLVEVVHRSGVDGLWSEMSSMMNLVRREICAKVDEYVVNKLNQGPDLQ